VVPRAPNFSAFSRVSANVERAGLLWGAAEKEAESLPRWPDERARRIGALAEEERQPVLDARERGLALDLWEAVEIALAG